MVEKRQIRIVVSHSTQVDEWITSNHYLKSCPPGAKLRLWVLDSEGETIGAMMWGRPTSRGVDEGTILELTRMFVIDDTEAYIESRILGMARKIIRKYMPQIKGLLAYSSTGEKHDGTIYRADNWFVFGKTRGGKWTGGNRVRADKDTSPKIRWLRSP